MIAVARGAAYAHRMGDIVLKILEFSLWGVLALAAIPVAWLFYVTFGSHVIGDLIERPPWSKTVRVIQIVLAPIVVVLAWQLDFKEFTYGGTAVLAGIGAYIWARTLLRGETWLWQREGRVNAEWAGPVALASLCVGYMSSAISPWF